MTVKNTIRVAQIRIEPEKGAMEENFARLCGVLDRLAPGAADVVVTSECFLDGYIAKESSVTPSDLAKYAIDPETSSFARAAAERARQLSAWIIFGCTRSAPSGIHNSAERRMPSFIGIQARSRRTPGKTSLVLGFL